jgi:N-acetylmuramoyl-L-alanine amidase
VTRSGRTAAAVAGALALAAAVAGCAGASVPTAEPVAQQAPTPTVTVGPDGYPEGYEAPLDTATVPSVMAAPVTHPRPTRTASRSAAPPVVRAAGRPVVVLDPGHNGGNASHPELISRLVPAGYGRTKPCNTVGASTFAGYPEHAFTFDVALRVRALLVQRGITVLLTRPTDTGVGPCVDARARFGNAHAAAAVVAIHADGADPAGHGFHVIEAAGDPDGPAVAAASHRLALGMRQVMLAESGLSYATYLANGTGLFDRTDIAGLNLSTRPAILVECGNMQNAHDAALESDPAGRQRIARALADGIVRFLGAG